MILSHSAMLKAYWEFNAIPNWIHEWVQENPHQDTGKSAPNRNPTAGSGKKRLKSFESPALSGLWGKSVPGVLQLCQHRSDTGSGENINPSAGYVVDATHLGRHRYLSMEHQRKRHWHGPALWTMQRLITWQDSNRNPAILLEGRL
jgi:hypothetical protein